MRTALVVHGRGFVARWRPYWLAAAGLFVATAVLGAALGAEGYSTILPIRSPDDPTSHTDALSVFAHNLRIGLVVAGGAFLVGMPTVYLIGYNGWVFGSTMVDAVAALGPLRSVMLVAPHGVVELPALWLAAAVGFRWAHLFWHLFSGYSPTGLRQAALDSAVALALVTAALALAALVEATLTVPLARAVT